MCEQSPRNSRVFSRIRIDPFTYFHYGYSVRSGAIKIQRHCSCFIRLFRLFFCCARFCTKPYYSRLYKLIFGGCQFLRVALHTHFIVKKLLPTHHPRQLFLGRPVSIQDCLGAFWAVLQLSECSRMVIKFLRDCLAGWESPNLS